MTQLFTLFAVSFTVLLFIFLAAQPTVAQLFLTIENVSKGSSKMSAS